MFKTISENASCEIVEKKSKFIANAFYIESVEEAEEIIKKVNKQYFDARHNCYAFSVFTENGIVNRFSDDRRTITGLLAGPMLNILTSRGLSNILVIVTRYFGGILLGTGGLVRAYSEATMKAIDSVNIIYKNLGLEAEIEVSYPDLQKLKYHFEKNKIKIINNEFGENVKVIFEITEEKLDDLIENKENFNFKIISVNIIKSKYIEKY